MSQKEFESISLNYVIKLYYWLFPLPQVWLPASPNGRIPVFPFPGLFEHAVCCMKKTPPIHSSWVYWQWSRLESCKSWSKQHNQSHSIVNLPHRAALFSNYYFLGHVYTSVKLRENWTIPIRETLQTQIWDNVPINRQL